MAKIEVKLNKKLPIPDSYKRVEYIKSQGTNSYISLPNVKDYDVTDLYIDYKIEGTYGVEYIYSINMILDTQAYQDNLRGSSSNVYIYNYGYYDATTYLGGEVNYDYAPLNSRNIFERSKNGILFNGKQPIINSDVELGYTPNGTTTDNIIIFGIKIGESIYATNTMSLYRFKIGNDTKWKYDLVPCVRKSDNVAGLYDVVNKVFYVAPENGNFTVGEEIEKYDDYIVDKSNGLKSVESLSQSTGQPKEIYYGVVPSSGLIQVIDKNGEIAQMIREDAIDNTEVSVKLSVNNKQLQNHLSTNAEYDMTNKNYSVQLSNKLDSYNSLIYNGYTYSNQPITAYNMLTSVLTTFGFTSIQITSMLTDVATRLQSITINTPYLKQATYTDTLNKFCELAQMQVYETDEGLLKFVDARPIVANNVDIISIPKSHQIAPLNRSLMLNNKFNKVKITPTKLVVNNNATLGSMDIKPTDKIFDWWNYEEGEVPSRIEYPVNNLDEFYLAKGFWEGGTSLGQWLQNSARIEVFVKTGSFEIEKTSDMITLKDETGSPTISISGYTFDVINWKANILSSNSETLWTQQNNSSAIYNEATTYDGATWSGQLNGESLTYTKIDQSQDSLNITWADTVTVTEQSNKYVVNYSVQTGSSKIWVYGSASYPENMTVHVAKIKQADSLSISVFGKKVQIDLSDQVTVGTGNNVYTYANNELLLDTNMVSNTPVTTNVANNIISDYSDGIITATTSLVCQDYYDTDKTLAKNWDNGDILQVGDIVRIDNDNDGKENLVIGKDDNDVFFKITGRNFRHSGVPLLDLELQEVVGSNTKLQFNYSPITSNGETVAYAIGTSGQSDSAMTNFDSKFTQITIPETYNGLPVTTILAQAFNGNYPTLNIKPNIISIEFNTNANKQFNIINYNGRVPVTESGSYVDNGLEAKVININKNVEELGDNLFCHQLYTGVLETKINFESNSKCKIIGRYTFRTLTITALNLPSSLETISGHAFNSVDFENLPNLIIPKSVKEIKDSAFYSADGFTNIKFEHSSSDTITLGSQIFYSKTARTATVYTDNDTIKNYNWAGDNMTVTLLHSDGTPWES